MAMTAANKHQQNSQATRDRLIEAAEQLFGSRSIDAVSISEITAAAGQKNRNALQYHFKNRSGLLQAIVEKHAHHVAILREDYFQRAEAGEWRAAEAAARCLIMPLVDYVRDTPKAVNFVKIVSQLSALNKIQGNSENALGIQFPAIPRLRELLVEAMTHLSRAEQEQRIFLAVNITFHGIADIYRASAQDKSNKRKRPDAAMFEQLVCALESFLAAPAIKTQ
ncbi:AcrR family transcriptional regulator [Litorivivens lipolytica]|uniref:AcrR family transcriptional regulator n=1 Tax=Litorivivens lipolytica TaxID=1524264 RepID=A0A7W4W7H8_9GAMM|nr:TetR family transcriptional regulator [Litorivivens lipolytica]MBB3048267.1 AcrR family transcriptional regulator [Litorivivens lipolytica]